MKILAFTDTHAQEKVHKALGLRVKAMKPDLLLCCGDLSIFGQGLKKTVQTIASWKIPCLVIHGNHEDEDETAGLIAPHKQLTFLHGKMVDIGGLTFVGWGGGGFSREDAGLARFLQTNKNELKAKKRIVFMTHAPPLGTELDALGPYHVGNKTVRDIPRLFPKTGVMLSGHIHETFLAHDVIQKTFLLNPGPLGVLLEMDEKHVSFREE